VSQDVQIMDQGIVALNPQDLAELGAIMATSGMTTLQARALVAKVQSVAAQVALAMAPEILEEIRRIQEARTLEMYQRVRLLPNQFGYVSRDRVLQIIQDVAMKTPRQ
jgi:hypothetical protein